MPSGSKKRKSSKKPKPQGDPSELEAGLEEAMGNNEEEVGEANLSPRRIEGDPEAMAERGLEGKEMNGEDPQEGDAVSETRKEGFQTDEAVPDQDKGSQEDPPSQAVAEPEIPAVVEEAKAPSVIELEGETAQGETEPQIDTSLLEFERRTDAAPEEIEPETESDAVPVESEPVTDAVLDASSDEIKPDADIGLDEVESSKESATVEREFVLDAAPIGSESGMDESSLETEKKTEIDKAPDQFKPETGEVESEIGVPLVDVNATPYIELKMNDAPDEVEPKTDGAQPEPEEAQVEEQEAAAPIDIEPETKEAPMERELGTDAAPTDVEAEAEEALAEMELAIDAAPADVEAEAEEAMSERELAIDAAPANVEPETAAPADIEPETEKAPMELAIDAAPVDVEPEMNATPVDTEAEADTPQVEIDTSPDEIQPEIDAASPENETVEIEPDVNAALVEAEQDEDAKIHAAPEPEPEVEALVKGEPEVSAEDVENSADIEAKRELPQEIETEPKPLDVAEDTSLEPPQEIEPESEVVAADESKSEDEAASVETNADERGSVETQSDQQALVGGETEAPPEIDPVPEVETSRGIELEAEAAVPLEAEPESVVEASAEDEKGPIETESDQQDLGEIEPYQSGVKEHDQQLLKQEGEAALNELDTSVSEDNQPSESRLQVAEALEVPVIEDEPPAISACDEANSVDDSTSCTLSSEASPNADNERTAIEQEPEEGDDIPSLVPILEGEGESIIEDVSDNQDFGGDTEQTRGAAVDNEQGVANVMPAESKEGISEEQERAVDVGHDDDGASAGNGGETEESSEKELAIELPPADVEESAKEDISEQERAVDFGLDEGGTAAGNGGETEESSEKELTIELPPADVEESAKEDISEQERAVDVGHDEDGAVLASARNGGEAEVSSELLPADVVDAEESSKEGPALSDQESVTEQPQPLTDEQDRSMGLGAAADEPPVLFEQSLNAILPSFGSEMTSDAPGEAVRPANDEKVASEHEYNHESACGELERDIGEEEAASSTVAEAGSVITDFDERGSYEQELPTVFPSTDQDIDFPDCKEFDDNSSIEAPESVETRLREQLDNEPSAAEKLDANAGCGLEATSEQQEVLLESPEAAKPAEDLHSAPVEAVSSDEQLPSSPQPEQVVPDSEDKIHSSTEVVLANEEIRTAEEERAACEDDKVGANSILGIAGDELISKAFTYLENGRESLSKSEGPSKELAEHRDESSVHQSETNNMDEAEIHAMDTKELKEAKHKLMGGDINNNADEAPVDSTSPIQDGRDIKGVQAFRQESTQEASLPVVVPPQDRAMEHVSVKSAERPNGGGTLERRTNLLGCCGMFDLLLRKS